jgi:predicted Fe-Mo cluster-binding NifX family protein
MKYAIPVSGGRLSAHFGQSTEFMLIDVDENNGQLTSKEVMSTIPHNCGNLPGLLADKEVSVVLAGGMGMGPRLAFGRHNIQVVLGVTETDPEKAVVSHLNRTLIRGQNICEHGDSICDHSSISKSSTEEI